MISFFLAKHFFASELHNSSQEKNNKASRPAIRIATGGIIVGLAIMIISLCFVKGFQDEIRRKLTGFTSHIELLNVKSFTSPEDYPILVEEQLVEHIKNNDKCKHIQRVSNKIGVLKTQNDFAGIILKGIGQDYDSSFLNKHIVEGTIPDFNDNRATNQVVISRTLAEILNLKVGDRIYSYFFSTTIKQRRFEIAAIYDTHMPQFDKSVVWTDIYTVNRLNGWNGNQYSKLEIQLSSFEEIESVKEYISEFLSKKMKSSYNDYSILSIKENPNTASVLSWLDLLDFNVIIILIIMIGVAGFTMISGLLILILERTYTIGILKTLGCTNYRIQQTFLWYSSFIVLRGMLWGNIIGILIVGIQYWYKLIHLNPDIYYIDYVPVKLDLTSILILNVACLLIIMALLVIPSLFVTRIEPAKSIKFD